MYYGSQSSDAYLQSSSGCTPATACYPSAISTYLATTPLDPTNSGNYQYKGLDNSDALNNQFYCYYAQLENNVGTRTTTFYTASQAGNFYRSTAPTTFGAGSKNEAAAAPATDCSASN